MSFALAAAALPADAIEVGRVQDAWGVKGWMKIHAFNNDPQAFFASNEWFLQPPEPRAGVRINFTAFTGTVLLAIDEAKEHSSGTVAHSLDVQDRTDAESLKGARIFIPRSCFPAPAPDEFYWVDLLGHTVINREGVVLGKVDDLHSTGPNTVLILGKIMIPFVSVYIDSVDQAAKTIRVDWQENYLD